MAVLTIKEIVADPESFVRRIEAGESVFVSSGSGKTSEIKLAEPPSKARTPDTFKGRMVVPIDFDAPLPEDMLDEIEGK